jgi:hypothetical protein
LLVKDYKKGMTKNSNGEIPPTLGDLQSQVDDIANGLMLWKNTIDAWVPTEEDKYAFHDVMEGFLGLLPQLSHIYYKIVSDLEKSDDYAKNMLKRKIYLSPEHEKLHSDFRAYNKIVMRIPDVRKKWRKSKGVAWLAD